MNNVTDIKEFKDEKHTTNKLKDYKDMTKALQNCYKLLRPYFKYRPIFSLGRTIVEIRHQILSDLKDMKKGGK